MRCEVNYVGLGCFVKKGLGCGVLSQEYVRPAVQCRDPVRFPFRLRQRLAIRIVGRICHDEQPSWLDRLMIPGTQSLVDGGAWRDDERVALHKKLT